MQVGACRVRVFVRDQEDFAMGSARVHVTRPETRDLGGGLMIASIQSQASLALDWILAGVIMSAGKGAPSGDA